MLFIPFLFSWSTQACALNFPYEVSPESVFYGKIRPFGNPLEEKGGAYMS